MPTSRNLTWSPHSGGCCGEVSLLLWIDQSFSSKRFFLAEQHNMHVEAGLSNIASLSLYKTASQSNSWSLFVISSALSLVASEYCPLYSAQCPGILTVSKVLQSYAVLWRYQVFCNKSMFFPVTSGTLGSLGDPVFNSHPSLGSRLINVGRQWDENSCNSTTLIWQLLKLS